MELSPQAVAAATFKTVKRGYDPDEVRAYLVEVSASLESSHQQATAMEARARAAIAKLQDATQQGGVAPMVHVPEEADTISRTLLLAQRTADTAIAEARAEAAAMAAKSEAEAAAITARAEAEAQSITSVARAEAASVVEQAGATAAQMIDAARAEARRTKDDEQLRAEREVHTLFARRETLMSDVDALEQYVTAERDRLRSVSATMLELADATPGGLAAAARPALVAGSALPAPTQDDTPVSMSRFIAESMPPPVAEPLITGQIPIVGAQPLVSPMPTSNEQARSMWHEAELADDAAAADDTVPIDNASGAGSFDDESTPAEGLRIGGDELR
jgi:DivIVA domain-containing protein